MIYRLKSGETIKCVSCDSNIQLFMHNFHFGLIQFYDWRVEKIDQAVLRANDAHKVAATASAKIDIVRQYRPIAQWHRPRYALYIHTYIHKGNLYTANNTEIRVTMRLQSVETSESSNVFEM